MCNMVLVVFLGLQLFCDVLTTPPSEEALYSVTPFVKCNSIGGCGTAITAIPTLPDGVTPLLLADLVTYESDGVNVDRPQYAGLARNPDGSIERFAAPSIFSKDSLIGNYTVRIE